jgi:ATP-dependent RNA helicase RhlB
MKFSEFNLHPDIQKGLDEAGFAEATSCQEQTITQVIKNSRDATVQSQTGTGKTAAFLLPIFQLLLDNPDFKGRKALIVAPTRELAVQIDEEAKLLGVHLPLRYGAFYGGVGYGQQEEMLKAGVDLIIGTPGRLLDFIQSRKINPKEFGFVVIDEADRLLDMGFYPDIKRLLGKMVPPAERRTMLLSATISTRVSMIAWEHMNDPADIVIAAERVTVDAIDQRLYHVSSDEKMPLLLGILKNENPSNAIIFTNTKRKAEEVAKRLEMNGYATHFIMGDLPQKKRLAIINEVKAGKVSYLVATDVAARGLHIEDLDMVVNYDLPEDSENYVHRIGRTARAGKTGKSVSMACEHFVYALAGIEKFINMKIPVAPMADELLVEDKSKGIRIQLSTWDEDGNETGTVSFRSRSGGRDGRDGRGGRNDRGGRDQRGGRVSRDGQGRPPRAETRGERRPDNRGPGVAKTPRLGQERPAEARQPRGGERPAHGKAAGLTVEERLAFYRQKYGDSFEPTPELLERLRREEQRAKEHAKRDHAGKSAPRGKPGVPRSGESADAGRAAGEARKKAAAPVATANMAPAKAEASNMEKRPQGGILGWIKGLFRGTKQP